MSKFRFIKPAVRKKETREAGQSLVYVAILMVVMIGFIGLAVDVGMLMAARRSLVRLTDAAALAGASALSAPASVSDSERQSRAADRVYEYVQLNGFDPTPGTGNITVTVSFPSFSTRKLVEVTTARRVNLGFMRLFGVSTSVVTSGARQGESVPIDIVLVMDTSGSQFVGNHWLGSDSKPQALLKKPWPYDGDIYNVPESKRAFGYNYDPNKRTTAYSWPVQGDPDEDGRTNIPWEPFVMQQDAARYFIDQLDSRYDRISIVSFSSKDYNESCGHSAACVNQRLTDDYNKAKRTIGYSPRTPGEKGTKGLTPWGGTAMAAGVEQGIAALTDTSYSRDEAIGAMILITDGSPTHKLDGTLDSGCDENTPSACETARRDVMDEVRNAAANGIVIYTIFCGSSEWESEKALILQWTADLTDNGQLDGDYTGSRNLPNGYGPAWSASWFQANVSENYYRAENQEELEAAYQSIYEKIYTRLVQ
ncbi:MAG: VWA domain-containing protein [Chloroflexi bacterium]|nr:VWA domain-containing protein [Chloroflexota bacterium]